MREFTPRMREGLAADDEAFARAFEDMAAIVTGHRPARDCDDRENLESVIFDIANCLRVTAHPASEKLTQWSEQVEYMLRPTGVMRRAVRLVPGWSRDAIGPILATKKEDGRFIALLPGRVSGYRYWDAQKERWTRVTKRREALFEEEAVCFYRALPSREITFKDMFAFAVSTVERSDWVMIALAAFIAALIGTLSPRILYIIYNYVIKSNNLAVLAAIGGFLVCTGISIVLMTAVKSIINGRCRLRMNLSMESAAMMRVLSLPAEFFRRYPSGEITSRMRTMTELCDCLVNLVSTSVLSALFSIIYVSQMAFYAPALVAPGLMVVLCTMLVTCVSCWVQMKLTRRTMELSAVEEGLNFDLLQGVQKIKLAGAEKRAFVKWSRLYQKEAALLYSPPSIAQLSGVMTTAISLIGTLVIYYHAISSYVSLSDYLAFNSAYGMVTGAFAALFAASGEITDILPSLEMIKPILTAVPETSKERDIAASLTGEIELNNVSFRYDDDAPLIIDNMTLKIESGQYVGIVGETGCGKSTLMRLMLGFETPTKGAVYYGEQDLKTLDLKSLRRLMGVVMQEGKLFKGSIYDNIALSAPGLSIEEAWRAAEVSGIADDIRGLPLGMLTGISEGSGGISGGQRQRLLIARAIAPKPRILMFDEATSALDNLSQKKVSDALDGLRCTRVVIAHRLSTIQNCDRILMIVKGKIAEDGTYKELIEKNGAFYKLVERQRLEETAVS